MAAKMRVVVNKQAVKELLRSHEIQADLERRAHAIAAAAGAGFSVRTHVGANRVRVTVGTDDLDAILAETYHQALTRAIDAGRD